MQRFHVDGWRGRVRSRLRPEHPGRPLQELSLPGRDLVGMNVKLLRQFGQRLLAPYGSQGHLRFESRRVVPAWSSAHRYSCSAAILAAVRQKLYLSNLFKNPEPALLSLVSRRLHAGRRSASRQASAEPCRRPTTGAWFWRRPYAFDTSATVHSRSSDQRTPDGIAPAFCRNAHHPGHWTEAACGGLDPDPAIRARGADPHLLCSKAARS